MQRPCRGGVTDTVVALGSAASSLARRASSATRKKASRAGGVGGAPHLPSGEHWGMRCVATASVEEFPALGGNPSRGRQCHGEQEGESILLGRDDSRVGMSRRRMCGCVGRCKPSAGPTRRQRGGPDSARAEPARACEAAASEYLPSRMGGNARERPQRPVRRSRSTAQAEAMDGCGPTWREGVATCGMQWCGRDVVRVRVADEKGRKTVRQRAKPGRTTRVRSTERGPLAEL